MSKEHWFIIDAGSFVQDKSGVMLYHG
jgi:hypothetical protein